MLFTIVNLFTDLRLVAVEILAFDVDVIVKILIIYFFLILKFLYDFLLITVSIFQQRVLVTPTVKKLLDVKFTQIESLNRISQI
jgi:hypothetical protein